MSSYSWRRRGRRNFPCSGRCLRFPSLVPREDRPCFDAREDLNPFRILYRWCATTTPPSRARLPVRERFLKPRFFERKGTI